MQGIFVTGTGTEVGKTVAAAFIARSFARDGLIVRVFKPVVTGLDEPGEPDHALLRRAANSTQSDEEIAPYRYGPAVAPHLAAAIAGEEIDPERLREAFATAAEGADAIVVEGVGGLLVPLNLEYTVRDLAVDLEMPLAIASPPGLGAINHTMLTFEAAQTAGLKVNTVVLTPWPEQPSHLEDSNRVTIAVLANLEVAAIPHVDLADPDSWPDSWRLLGPPQL
jgi:dethiobiotin synthetase